MQDVINEDVDSRILRMAYNNFREYFVEKVKEETDFQTAMKVSSSLIKSLPGIILTSKSNRCSMLTSRIMNLDQSIVDTLLKYYKDNYKVSEIKALNKAESLLDDLRGILVEGIINYVGCTKSLESTLNTSLPGPEMTIEELAEGKI